MSSLRAWIRSARERVDGLGNEYLAEVSRMDPLTRAMALSSYEDGGLEAVFRAILTAPDWNEPSLAAFKHFLVEHIKLDSGDESHGSLCRHLVADDRILPLWIAFHDLLIRLPPVSLTRRAREWDDTNARHLQRLTRWWSRASNRKSNTGEQCS